MKIQNNINLGKKTTLKTWWNSKFFTEIKTKEDLFEVFKYSKENNLKIIPLWLWSNTFFSWDLEDKIVVKLKNGEIEKMKLSCHPRECGDLVKISWINDCLKNNESLDSSTGSEWQNIRSEWQNINPEWQNINPEWQNINSDWEKINSDWENTNKKLEQIPDNSLKNQSLRSWILKVSGMTKIWQEDTFFKIQSWAILWNIINKLAKDDFDLSPLAWFPSSIWWAIVWNAGLLWKEIRDYLISAEVFNLKTWEFENWENEDFWFEYRFSKLKWKNDYLVWSWVFNIPKWENILEKIRELTLLRIKKQPQWRSAGSFFKNPEWDFAGRLIEEVWLKWFKIWWAYFSEKHANFLTTENWVKKEDIVKLKNLAKNKVRERFWIELEEEVVVY